MNLLKKITWTQKHLTVLTVTVGSREPTAHRKRVLSKKQ